MLDTEKRYLESLNATYAIYFNILEKKISSRDARIVNAVLNWLTQRLVVLNWLTQRLVVLNWLPQRLAVIDHVNDKPYDTNNDIIWNENSIVGDVLRVAMPLYKVYTVYISR